MGAQRTHRARTFLTIATIVVGGISGCVSYSNVEGPQSPPAFKSPNHFMAAEVMQKSLAWVIARHEPINGSLYTVNLPIGTTAENAQEVFDAIPPGAISPGAASDNPLGMYHVGRVWIRASEAKVDVVYPFRQMDGSIAQRGVTVWLQGGVRDSRVVRGQYWSPGTVMVPEVSVPKTEAEIEAEKAAEKAHTSRSSEDVEVESRVRSESMDDTAQSESVPASSGETDDASLWREVPSQED